MTVTEAMRQALEQTQRINRLQRELAEASAARAKALSVVGPALAIQGAPVEVLNLTPPAAPVEPEQLAEADEANIPPGQWPQPYEQGNQAAQPNGGAQDHESNERVIAQ